MAITLAIINTGYRSITQQVHEKIVLMYALMTFRYFTRTYVCVCLFANKLCLAEIAQNYEIVFNETVIELIKI